MKVLLCFLAVLPAMMIECTESPVSNDKDFNDCLVELKMQDMKLNEVIHKHAYPCLLACIQEKAGVMVRGKIQIEKYVENYMESANNNPNNVHMIRSKLIECALKANKLENKCLVADYTGKCEATYQEILFP